MLLGVLAFFKRATASLLHNDSELKKTSSPWSRSGRLGLWVAFRLSGSLQKSELEWKSAGPWKGAPHWRWRERGVFIHSLEGPDICYMYLLLLCS
jgi:hypothetical protein